VTRNGGGLREAIASWLLEQLGEPVPEQPPRRAAEPAPRRATDPRAASDRRRLVLACIEVADQVGSEMLRERLHDALDGVGVRPFRADGEPFDPARHESAGTVPTDDAAQDGLVAVTQSEGYADRDGVVRVPKVLVWRRGAR
jgi:molecular chaperone GrpE